MPPSRPRAPPSGAWSATSVGERADYLAAIAGKLAERTEDLARTISAEMGCPISISRAIQLGLPLNSFAEAANIVREYEFESEYRGSTIVPRAVRWTGRDRPGTTRCTRSL